MNNQVQTDAFNYTFPQTTKAIEAHFSAHKYEEDAPQTKMSKYGSGALSDSELLCVALGYKSAEKGRAKIEQFQGLANVVNEVQPKSLEYAGVSEAEALKITAIGELARRINSAPYESKIKFTEPEMVSAFFGPKIRHLKHEVFYVMFLDNAKHMTAYHKISQGGSNATIVEPAEVLRQAIIHKASSIVLVHNHPSGVCKASSADINLTKRIAESGKMLGIPVLDHVIIAGYEYLSMRTERLFS